MTSPQCYFCKSMRTCPIVYGYPADIEAYLENIAKGNFFSGGCFIEKTSPKWHCHDCGQNWGKYHDF